MNLAPFFAFYGGKWRAAPKYIPPAYGVVIEPFAGAAGYSTRYAHHKVFLVDKDPVIASLWKWLITSSYDDVMQLPIMSNEQTVDDLNVPQEAKYLIGFWLNKGATSPCKSPSKWMREGLRPNSFWGEAVRKRIAEQVRLIKHWEVLQDDYVAAPDVTATWFIDPPYQEAGNHYRYPSRAINFGHLGTWCRTRKGQVMVCENVGADWLPFSPFLRSKSMESSRRKKKSYEAIWTNGMLLGV